MIERIKLEINLEFRGQIRKFTVPSFIIKRRDKHKTKKFSSLRYI